MSWHQLSITTDEITAPLIADFFSECGAVSVTYMDAKDEPVYEPAIGETKIWQQTTVIGLYELKADPTIIKAKLWQQFETEKLLHWQLERIEDQAWERTWLEYYQPMKFADKLWVCPTDQAQNEVGTVCMTLDPALAFGTGTHATTALCLEWLASHDIKDKIVIDYGCGSGILAVAALLLGAKYAYAVDIDPQALTATKMNAEKNQVDDKISLFLAQDFQPIEADLVLANILAKPLVELSTLITSLVKKDGQLILSGILNEQALDVQDAYKKQFDFSPVTQQQDWCRLDASKRLN
ncbi:MAG: 50S ribosomal protein L11 methyltransferase [Methylococcales bacterium]|nr:50S ribosomal protein L11 methyltransferase [Methylococcales bacterium]